MPETQLRLRHRRHDRTAQHRERLRFVSAQRRAGLLYDSKRNTKVEERRDCDPLEERRGSQDQRTWLVTGALQPQSQLVTLLDSFNRQVRHVEVREMCRNIDSYRVDNVHKIVPTLYSFPFRVLIGRVTSWGQEPKYLNTWRFF